MLAVGCHLRDVDGQRTLNCQKDFAWSLKIDRTIRGSVLLCNAGGRKRSIFELNINAAVNRTHAGRLFHHRNQIGRVGFGKRRQEPFDFNLLMHQAARRCQNEHRAKRDRDNGFESCE